MCCVWRLAERAGECGSGLLSQWRRAMWTWSQSWYLLLPSCGCQQRQRKGECSVAKFEPSTAECFCIFTVARWYMQNYWTPHPWASPQHQEATFLQVAPTPFPSHSLSSPSFFSLLFPIFSLPKFSYGFWEHCKLPSAVHGWAAAANFQFNFPQLFPGRILIPPVDGVDDPDLIWPTNEPKTRPTVSWSGLIG